MLFYFTVIKKMEFPYFKKGRDNNLDISSSHVMDNNYMITI